MRIGHRRERKRKRRLTDAQLLGAAAWRARRWETSLARTEALARTDKGAGRSLVVDRPAPVPPPVGDVPAGKERTSSSGAIRCIKNHPLSIRVSGASGTAVDAKGQQGESLPLSEYAFGPR